MLHSYNAGCYLGQAAGLQGYAVCKQQDCSLKYDFLPSSGLSLSSRKIGPAATHPPLLCGQPYICLVFSCRFSVGPWMLRGSLKVTGGFPGVLHALECLLHILECFPGEYLVVGLVTVRPYPCETPPTSLPRSSPVSNTLPQKPC